ncbi:hypothetical protein VNI00_004531 [Paramarasmius palmivorus]|uniref:GH18 domain-containing protein n=1 Tax=Paramarasmius palmivorus TaxID=297713 RepID=A0AAW0DIY8_9AGAR
MFTLIRLAILLAPILAVRGLDLDANLPRDGKSAGKVAKSWYNANSVAEFPVSAIPWSKYNQVAYSFGVPTEDPGVVSLSYSRAGPEVLPNFVKAAHDHGVLAILSIGGWNGSVHYSTAVGSPSNRTQFVKALTDLVTKYDLDGLDFDWEYPNRQGIGCNSIQAHDTDNFLAFLQELRRDPVGSKLVLSAPSSVQPWNDASGNPSTDLSAFATVLDHIAVMNYDVNGPWGDVVAPNAPLNDTCAPPNRRVSSAIDSINAWHKAGIPKNQLVLGVAFYGHGYSVNKTDAYKKGSKELALYPAFNKNIHPKGDKFDDPDGLVDPCGVANPPGGTFSFRGLIEGGYLNKDGSPRVSYLFDECSQTAYVYKDKDEVMVSYDDKRAAEAKGKFIKDAGIAGFAAWHTGGDYNNILIDGIRKNMGF